MKDRLIPECLKAFSKRQRTVLFLLIAITVLLGLLFPILLSSDPRSVLTVSRSYRPGELSDEDVIAPFDFSYVDDKATADETAEAARSVLPHFYYSVSESMAIRGLAEGLSDAIASGTGAEFISSRGLDDSEDIAARLSEVPESMRPLLAQLVTEGTSYLIDEGVFLPSDLNEALGGGYSEIVIEDSGLSFRYSGETRKASSLITEGGTYEAVSMRASDKYPDLPSSYSSLISDAVSMVVTANVFYDPVLTTSLREEKASTVPPVLIEIHRGDYIIQRDTVVTEQQLRTLQRIFDSSVISMPVEKAAGYLVYLVLFTLLLVYLLFFFIKYRYRLSLYTTIFLVGIDLTLCLSYLLLRILPENGVSFTDPFLPLILLPALSASITGRRRLLRRASSLGLCCDLSWKQPFLFLLLHRGHRVLPDVHTLRHGKDRYDLPDAFLIPRCCRCHRYRIIHL